MLDADGDGATNREEYIAGTDPRNPSDRFAIASVMRNAQGQFVITFTAQAGKTYTIQFRDGLTAGVWQKLVDVPAAAAGTTAGTDTSSAGIATRFYRVVTPWQP